MLGGGCGDSADPGTRDSSRVASVSKAPSPKAPEDAAKVLSEEIDFPVTLPKSLPRGAEVAGVGWHGRSGYITVKPSDGRVLTMQYGDAGFDGCGPRNPKQVRVGDEAAVISTTRQGKGSLTTLVWPATLQEPRGQYALSGEYTPSEMLSLAASMDTPGTTRARASKRDC